ncbi:hypothetical protein ACIRYZ_14450 [Kitasatospora sp. NPDC101155]|uniref:hypothetical protein n=1 Tax=Kitasatospora sp. NPDC101155 TaxID=3364097 RepID=UPI003803D875
MLHPGALAQRREVRLELFADFRDAGRTGHAGVRGGQLPALPCAQYGDDLFAALGAVAARLLDGASEWKFPPLGGRRRRAPRRHGPQRRRTGDHSSAGTDRRRPGQGGRCPDHRTVFGPSCGPGTRLLAVGPPAHRYGQDLDPAAVGVTELGPGSPPPQPRWPVETRCATTSFPACVRPGRL